MKLAVGIRLILFDAIKELPAQKGLLLAQDRYIIVFVQQTWVVDGGPKILRTARPTLAPWVQPLLHPEPVPTPAPKGEGSRSLERGVPEEACPLQVWAFLTSAASKGGMGVEPSRPTQALRLGQIATLI